jgi:hypothetical protein
MVADTVRGLDETLTMKQCATGLPIVVLGITTAGVANVVMAKCRRCQ